MSEGESIRGQPGLRVTRRLGQASPRVPMVMVSLPSQPTSFPSQLLSSRQEAKMGKRQRLSFPPRTLAGSAFAVSLKGWSGLGALRKGNRCLCPLQRGWHCPCLSSAGAQCWAALRTVAHQALVGFEARQGLAAGDGSQGAAEAQHGGRGVLPWGKRVGEVGPGSLHVCGWGCRRQAVKGQPSGPPSGGFPISQEYLLFLTRPREALAQAMCGTEHKVTIEIVSLCLCLP